MVHLLQRATHTHCTTHSDTQPGQTTNHQANLPAILRARRATVSTASASRARAPDRSKQITANRSRASTNTKPSNTGATSGRTERGTPQWHAHNHADTQSMAHLARHAGTARRMQHQATQHTYNHTRKRQTYRARQVRRGTPHGSNKLTRHAHDGAHARDRHADCGTLHARAPSGGPPTHAPKQAPTTEAISRGNAHASKRYTRHSDTTRSNQTYTARMPRTRARWTERLANKQQQPHRGNQQTPKRTEHTAAQAQRTRDRRYAKHTARHTTEHGTRSNHAYAHTHKGMSRGHNGRYAKHSTQHSRTRSVRTRHAQQPYSNQA